MQNCKVHRAAKNLSPSTCTLSARSLLLDTSIAYAGDTAFAPPEENVHSQKGQKGLTMLPFLKALHTDGAMYGSTEGITWQEAAPHTWSDSGCINAP